MRKDPIALVDLDDTLFQTLRKIDPSIPESDLTIAAVAGNGSHSYMTKTQVAFSDWLLATTEAIPVTARSSDVLGRVTIPFRSYAIVANGAVILGPDGKPDAEWQTVVEKGLRPLAAKFEELLAEGKENAERLGVSVRSWIVMEGDLGTYVVFKENDGDGSRLQEVAPVLAAELGWVRHHNGNNLALIPPAISKRLASEFLLARLLADSPDRPVIGFGDSVSDMSYLGLCGWWSAPGKSQITDLVVKAMAH